VNEALRLLRQPKMTVVADDHPQPRGEEPSDAMDQRETVRKVRAAIDKLPEHYKAALVLCEYEQMPYAEIATTLNASVPQIKTWIHRARRQLAVLLKEFAERS
jgi:RNA polymerase sigma-70 factor (ECF subfamily)